MMFRKSACCVSVTTMALLWFGAGCESTNTPSKYTQAQLNAIETREVDANFSDTFSAASSALFDAGYTIAMSDKAAGLLTGEAAKDQSAARIWVSPYVQDTKFRLSMQIREIGPRLTSVRVKGSVNGEPTVDKKAIDAIWTLMQRQVMMKDPPASTVGG
jgi:hypothetical protein